MLLYIFSYILLKFLFYCILFSLQKNSHLYQIYFLSSPEDIFSFVFLETERGRQKHRYQRSINWWLVAFVLTQARDLHGDQGSHVHPPGPAMNLQPGHVP